MRFLIFIVVLLVALIGLLSPKPPPALFPYIGFVLHCLGFTTLSLTARVAFRQAANFRFWSILLAAAPAAEFLQLLQPLRSFNYNDIFANLLGVVLAAITWLFYTYMTSQHFVGRYFLQPKPQTVRDRESRQP